ncbi:MAG TPA: HEAT repeat domain-containing protein, partial [Xanthomonadales bacterium]|nr:HEAT repeat domain-containing protein [Xanthomonadales bacterium]
MWNAWCRTIIASVALAAAGSASAQIVEPPPSDCADVERCIAELRAVAAATDGNNPTGPAAASVAIRLAGFGDEAVPSLVALLDDPDLRVAQLAGNALGEVPHIDAQYLPAIRRGLDRDLAGLAPALAAIDSDDAVREAMARYLRSGDDFGLEMALDRMGKRAVPVIVEAARCASACAPDQDRRLWSLLLHFSPGGARREVADGLMAIVEDESLPPEMRRNAINLLIAAGEDARGLDARLLAIRPTNPDWHYLIDLVLVKIGSDAAGAIHAEQLARSFDASTVYAIAKSGSVARNTGPQLLEHRDDEDPEVRLAVVQALGAIGYEPAVPALVAKLDDAIDWRMPMFAANALGLLQDASALPALRRLARNHWYPEVREAAEAAIASIESHVVTEQQREVALRRVEYRIDERRTQPCERVALEMAVDATPRMRMDREDEDTQASRQLAALAYTEPNPPPPPPPPLNGEAMEIEPPNRI